MLIVTIVQHHQNLGINSILVIQNIFGKNNYWVLYYVWPAGS